MSYGPNWPSLWRRAAEVVDKILRGAKPADIPVEQPRTFELVINLKTAKTLKRTTPCTRTTPWKASDRHLRLLRPGAIGGPGFRLTSHWKWPDPYTRRRPESVPEHSWPV